MADEPKEINETQEVVTNEKEITQNQEAGENNEKTSQEAKEAAEPKTMDTGLACFVTVARINGIGVNPEQLQHTFALKDHHMSVNDMLRAAKELGFKAKAVKLKLGRLPKVRFPAVAALKDGRFVVLAKLEKEKLLIYNPLEKRPSVTSLEKFEEEWTGQLVLLAYRGLREEGTKFGFKWFIPAVIKYKKPIIEVLVSSFTIQVLGVFAPLITQVVIDKVLVHRGFTTLDVLAFGLFVIALFEMIMGIAKTYVFTHTTSRIDVSLGAKLFKHLFSIPLRYFEVRRVGETIARVRELENIRRFLTGAPLTSFLDVMFITVYLAVMIFYSTSLTWVILGSLPLFVALSAIVTPLFKKRLDEKFRCGAESQSYLVEAVSGVQTVKSFALEPEVQKKWESLLANYVKSSFKTAILSGNAGAIGQFIQKGSDLLVLWLGAHLVIEGTITIGQLIAFRMLSSRVSGPVLRLVQLWQEFQQASLSVQRLGDIFNTTPEPALNPAKTQLPAIKGKITFEGVRFRYRVDGPEIIRDMSFVIPGGTVVGVVGRSGSGKSTISKLMQRLYIPEAGKILVDGIDISLADPSWLRRQIGVVLQENFLFNGSVRDNIAIHHPAASMTEIMRVAQIAGAHEFILDLPEGYETMVGEKGTGLSGGQRQRVAIARALLTNPRILIFDEATSALDYESERIIQKNLKLICRGRTVIIIAHRLSTLRDAHKIMAIDKGKLIEYGTHEELLSQKGLYQYLYSQQERGL